MLPLLACILQPLHFRQQHAPACIFNALAQCHQAREQGVGRGLICLVQGAVDRVGAPAQCATDATELAISGQRQAILHALLEQLAQGVLQ